MQHTVERSAVSVLFTAASAALLVATPLAVAAQESAEPAPAAPPMRESLPPDPEESLENAQEPAWAPWRDEPAPPQAPAPADPEGLAAPFVPVQQPVPAPPDLQASAKAESPAVSDTYTLRDRFFDVSLDLGRRVAQDGGFAFVPRFGGLAADIIPWGAGQPFGSALRVDLDGNGLNIPIAARGVNYLDLRLVPVAGIEAYTISPGAYGGGFGGHVALRSRRIQGVEGALLIGDRDVRQIGVVGGTSSDKGHATIAFESRAGRGPLSPTSEDLMSVLASVGWRPTDTFELGAQLRYYRGIWDDPGALTPRAVNCDDPASIDCHFVNDFAGATTDGGELRGTGGGFNLRWALSDRTETRASFSYLDDRFNRYNTDGAAQQEQRDYNRVARAQALVSTAEFGDWGIEEIALGGDFEYDHGISRTFATEDRDRLFQTRDLRGDWVKGGGFARVRLRFFESLSITLEGGVDSLYLRRTEPRLGAEAQTRQTLSPVYRAEIGYGDADWGVALRLAKDNNPAPGTFVSALGSELQPPDLIWETEQASLLGRVQLRFDDWLVGARATAYGALYGRALLTDDNSGTPRVIVLGGDVSLDVEHTPTNLALVARGGPAFGTLDGVSDWGRAPGVPNYAVHVGLLRRVDEGFVGEAWFSAYGEYGLFGGGESVLPALAPGQQDVSLRVGYRFAQVALWVGATNLLDGAIAAGPDNVVRRSGRVVYAMVNVLP